MTPLGAFTGLLMPDVFAGVTVMVIATLAVHWRQLAAGERAGLGVLLLFALSALLASRIQVTRAVARATPAPDASGLALAPLNR